jgi:hypothetical protein
MQILTINNIRLHDYYSDIKDIVANCAVEKKVERKIDM